jgi:hypothetical protein
MCKFAPVIACSQETRLIRSMFGHPPTSEGFARVFRDFRAALATLGQAEPHEFRLSLGMRQVLKTSIRCGKFGSHDLLQATTILRICVQHRSADDSTSHKRQILTSLRGNDRLFNRMRRRLTDAEVLFVWTAVRISKGPHHQFPAIEQYLEVLNVISAFDKLTKRTLHTQSKIP